MKKIFLLFIVIFSCKAQQEVHIDGHIFYIKSHELLDSFIAMQKYKDTIYTLEQFDFNNQKNLGNSLLFAKMFKWSDSIYLSKSPLMLTQREMDFVRDNKGWLTSNNKVKNSKWNVHLFANKKTKLVQEYKRKQLLKKGGKIYMYVKPVQINFKENFALMEVKNLFGGGYSLYLFKYIDGLWLLIEFASDPQTGLE